MHAEKDIFILKNKISCFVVRVIDRLWDEQRRGKPIQSVLLKATKRLCTVSIPQAVWASGGWMVRGALVPLAASPENFLFTLEGKSSLCNCI